MQTREKKEEKWRRKIVRWFKKYEQLNEDYITGDYFNYHFFKIDTLKLFVDFIDIYDTYSGEHGSDSYITLQQTVEYFEIPEIKMEDLDKIKKNLFSALDIWDQEVLIYNFKNQNYERQIEKR